MNCEWTVYSRRIRLKAVLRTDARSSRKGGGNGKTGPVVFGWLATGFTAILVAMNIRKFIVGLTLAVTFSFGFGYGPVLSHAQDVIVSPINDGQTVAATDWPWWRGPFRNGTAVAEQSPPTVWSDTENVLWKARVPGRGHASPIVVGDSVYLPTADRERNLQSVLCFDRANGKQKWE